MVSTGAFRRLLTLFSLPSHPPWSRAYLCGCGASLTVALFKGVVPQPCLKLEEDVCVDNPAHAQPALHRTFSCRALQIGCFGQVNDDL